MALGAAALSTAAAGDIYKWIGVDGGVNYADAPPPGIPSERLDIAPADAQTPVVEPGWQLQRAPDWRKPADTNAVGLGAVDPGARGALALRKQRCLQARMRIAMLGEALPVYRDEAGKLRAEWRYDTYRGEREYINDLTRTAEIARMRAIVSASCEDPDDDAEQALARRRWMMSEYCAKQRSQLESAQHAEAGAVDARRRLVARYCGA